MSRLEQVVFDGMAKVGSEMEDADLSNAAYKLSTGLERDDLTDNEKEAYEGFCALLETELTGECIGEFYPAHRENVIVIV